MAKTLNDWYRDAIQVQDACNLSGVVRSFAEANSAIREAYPNEGTDFWNHHPIAVMFSAKVSDLTGSESVSGFSAAYEACKAETT